jgi:hypothetical protein
MPIRTLTGWIRTCLVGVATLGAFTASAAVVWSTPSGSTPYFDYANGQSDNGLFGSPNIAGNTFAFFPSSFVAQSSNGSSANVSDRLSFTLYAKPGQTISGIKITEAGDYSILGTGTVNAQGALFVTNLNQFAFQSDTLHTTPTFPLGTNSFTSGLWGGYSQVTLPNGWTKVQVVMNNILQTQAGANSSAEIDKKVVGAEVLVSVIVPEPGTIGLLTIGGAMFLLRRSRKTA